MSYVIDLNELSQRESESVEWKENGDDKNIEISITKTICAFANDISNLGGGYFVCGAKEIKDEYGFQKVKYTGLSADKLKKIEGKVLQYCRDYINPSIAPITQEIKNPDDVSTRVLVFIITVDSRAHAYKDGNSTNYYVRIGRETRIAQNGIYRQLLEKKQEIEPFDKRANPNTDAFDIDSMYFRDYLEAMGLLKHGKQPEDFVSDKEKLSEFIPPVLVKNSLDNSYCLRNYALLAFGKKDSIYQSFTEACMVISFYNDIDRNEPSGKRYMLTGTIIEQAKKSVDLLEMSILTNFDKKSNKPNKEKYSKRAIQEAVINAIVHRDYQMADPIRITVFTDRIEIWSPGTLHWGIDKELFKEGKSGPRWRNQTFAYIFNKLRLAQAEGQGIHTIIQTMRAEGCPDPLFDIGVDSVKVILYANLNI